jgi:thiosulfate/3-mercaptopyruvate sulfurtransferase
LQPPLVALLGILSFFLCPAIVGAEKISAVVDTDWLARNLDSPEVLIIDIRAPAQFNKGHIPGSLNAPLRLWAISNNGLTLELPSDERLKNLLGTFGIHPSSRVIVVGGTETDFSRADATRVAWTCKVARIGNVAVLDGGYNQWAKGGRTVTTDAFHIHSYKYDGNIDRSSSISMGEVISKIGKSTIVDTRTPEDYFGATSKSGHIKTALCLPAPWAFSGTGTFREKRTLRAMAEGVIGPDRSREVIVYCEVGGYASTWWFVLTQILAYQNVRLYDGSMEEWIRDPAAPVQVYSWH